LSKELFDEENPALSKAKILTKNCPAMNYPLHVKNILCENSSDEEFSGEEFSGNPLKL
jgi:hypothetical protein